MPYLIVFNYLVCLSNISSNPSETLITPDHEKHGFNDNAFGHKSMLSRLTRTGCDMDVGDNVGDKSVLFLYFYIIRSQLTFWTSNQSNSINGSDGSAFHPLLDKNERIYIFTPDLCRYCHLKHKNTLIHLENFYQFPPLLSSNGVMCEMNF